MLPSWLLINMPSDGRNPNTHCPLITAHSQFTMGKRLFSPWGNLENLTFSDISYSREESIV